MGSTSESPKRVHGSHTSQGDDNSLVCFIYCLRNHEMADIVVREEFPREQGGVKATDDEAMPLIKFMADVIGTEI